MDVRELRADEARQCLPALAKVLLDCVRGGASVGFMESLTREEAEAFFTGCIDEVERGRRVLLAAFIDGELLGTVQAIWATPPNQPHRADVAKLLVHRKARRRGVARALME